MEWESRNGIAHVQPILGIGREISAFAYADSKVAWASTCGSVGAVKINDAPELIAQYRLTGMVTAISWCGDNRIVLGFSCGLLRVLELQHGVNKNVFTKVGHGRGIGCVECNNEIVVSGSNDPTLIVWDLRKGGRLLGPLRGHNRGIRCIEITDDVIISAAQEETVRVWDKRSGVLKGVLQHGEGCVTCLAVSLTRIVTVLHNGIICVWDMSTLQQIMVFRERKRCVNSMSIWGMKVVTVGEDGWLHMWDLSNGQLIGSVRVGGRLMSILDCHDDRVLCGCANGWIKLVTFDWKSNRKGHSSASPVPTPPSVTECCTSSAPSVALSKQQHATVAVPRELRSVDKAVLQRFVQNSIAVYLQHNRQVPNCAQAACSSQASGSGHPLSYHQYEPHTVQKCDMLHSNDQLQCVMEGVCMTDCAADAHLVSLIGGDGMEVDQMACEMNGKCRKRRHLETDEEQVTETVSKERREFRSPLENVEVQRSTLQFFARSRASPFKSPPPPINIPMAPDAGFGNSDSRKPNAVRRHMSMMREELLCIRSLMFCYTGNLCMKKTGLGGFKRSVSF